LNICNKGISLGLTSPFAGQIETLEDNSITFQCFEQEWSGTPRWSRSHTSKNKYALLIGIEIKFLDKHSKHLWIKHIYNLNTK
ncbi:MAG: hypothetical protein CMK59_12140, partial [Proteobacteria bacterium]|nr:hypothetical protein [Pseudomonadota bacterium]